MLKQAGYIGRGIFMTNLSGEYIKVVFEFDNGTQNKG